MVIFDIDCLLALYKITKNICIVYHNAIPLHKIKVKNEPKITSFKTINYNIRE